MQKKLKKNLLENKFLYSIVILYFIFRLINLTAFPLFNDESIYLDWGLREVNLPGNLFYSLYDAKQPLLMWIFGIMENILPDAIFAGRLVSVFTGLLTLLGLYKLTKISLDKRTGLIVSFLYIFIPLFSFYDRQALMESAIASIGVWGCYFTVKSLLEDKLRNFIYLGVILGLGYFIKSSSIIFLITSVLLIIYFSFRLKKKHEKIKGLAVLLISFLASILWLIINPMYWQTLQTNSRFSFGITDLLGFPIQYWITNFSTNLRVAIFYVTPVIFIGGLVGLGMSFKKNKNTLLIALYFIISLSLETLLVRNSIDRYVSAFLPLLLLLFGIIIKHLADVKKTKVFAVVLIIAALSTSLPVTLLQIYNQAEYLIQYGRVSGVNYPNYLDSFTTGYGLEETFLYIDNAVKDNNALVGVALNTGNPENAVFVRYSKSVNIKTIYFDSRILPPEINNFDCLSFGKPLYFITRENQLVGLDKFLVNVKFTQNPYGTYKVGIYTLKADCPVEKTVLINLP